MEYHIVELGSSYLKIGLSCSISFWLTNMYTLIFETDTYNRLYNVKVKNISDIRTNVVDVSLLSGVMLFLWPYIYPMFLLGYCFS